MGHRPSCRSCRHCIPPSGVNLGRCQLRQLPIHPEWVEELWCHHWTAPAPRLPVVAPGGATAPIQSNQQLSLSTMLPES